MAQRLARDPRRRLAVHLARRTLAALGVPLVVRGTVPPPGEPLLVVGNHISWLDIYLLNAVMECRFVAKAETRRWPLVGSITRTFDAIFIVRGSFRDARRVKTVVAAALRAGERVVVFPEGTTTDGTCLKRFHPALFEAAIEAGVRVQPVALRYPDAHGRPDPRAAFIDDVSLVASIAGALREPALHAEMIFGAPITPAGRTRQELARLARQTIAAQLGLGPRAIEPERPSVRMRRARTAA
jgi:1-acyl-sn-glycerol-3-phosphate acyltransferase